LWEQAVVPLEISRLRPDVYHSPNYIVPVALRCPIVVTVHDMLFLDRRLQRLRSHLYLRTLTAIAVRKADRVICVSQHTLDDFRDRFPDVAPRARLVTEGVNHRFQPSDPDTVERFRAAHNLPERYMLFVGTFEPRKNLTRLIAAYERAVYLSDAPDHLVLCGGRGWKNADVFARIDDSRLRERIHVLGYVPDADLPAAYTGCSLFVYPSLAEGFGLPPVEAMACGAPVVTSDAASLPEAVGDAALLFDPLDIGSIADRLAQVVSDEPLRRTLVAAGFVRAAELSWDMAAAQTRAVYEEVA
jgi:glycosyltransferase involved in cell wall biosynthesis